MTAFELNKQIAEQLGYKFDPGSEIEDKPTWFITTPDGERHSLWWWQDELFVRPGTPILGLLNWVSNLDAAFRLFDGDTDTEIKLNAWRDIDFAGGDEGIKFTVALNVYSPTIREWVWLEPVTGATRAEAVCRAWLVWKQETGK